MSGGFAAATALTAGVGVGYKRHDDLQSLARKVRGLPPASADDDPSEHQFNRDADRIRKLQSQQNLETVKQLKAKYEGQVFGKVRVWDLIEKLGQCIDPSDDSLLLTSQLVHVQQVIAGMERDGIQNRDMFLLALLHDLGKVMLLTPEVPEHIVGFIEPIGEYNNQAGLDSVVFQFGHDEFMYKRLKDHVPEHIAWAIRYHSAVPGSIVPYMNDKERSIEKELLAPFRVYDQGTKSYRKLPQVDMRRYREMIEALFPNPILV